jgi:hypothetical protein
MWLCSERPGMLHITVRAPNHLCTSLGRHQLIDMDPTQASWLGLGLAAPGSIIDVRHRQGSCSSSSSRRATGVRWNAAIMVKSGRVGLDWKKSYPMRRKNKNSCRKSPDRPRVYLPYFVDCINPFVLQSIVKIA